MTPSAEYLALKALEGPVSERAGDMYLCRRLGIVKLLTGHKRGQRRYPGATNVHLYHWGKPSLVFRPCDWREFDANSHGFNPANYVSEKWTYIGNLFRMVPYSRLAATPPVSEEAK